MSYITIDGFENLTKQEVFDIAYKHINTTKRKSVMPTGCRHSFSECVYSGSGCAAAPFIKEECRSTRGSWSSLAFEGLVPDTNAVIVDHIQICHDSAIEGELFLEEFNKKMSQVAEHYGLKIPEVNNV